MASCTLLLLLASFSGALASLYYGGSMTFTPKGRNPDGSFMVDFRYKQTFDSCYPWNTWYCRSGNCGNQSTFVFAAVDQGNDGVTYNKGGWCQTEGLITRNIPSNRPFEMRNLGCCWVSPIVIGPSSIMTQVDLGIRSDTGEPNRSPVTTIIPFIRIPQNCPRTLNLLAHDPDNDRVRCRYAHGDECVCSGKNISGFHLDQNSCTLTYMHTSVQNAHAFQMVLEDYPRQQITLSYTDGTRSIKYPQIMRYKRWYYGTTLATTTPILTTPKTTTPKITTPPIPTTTKTTIRTTAETTTPPITTTPETTTPKITTSPIPTTTKTTIPTMIHTTYPPISTKTEIRPVYDPPFPPVSLSTIPLQFAIQVDPPVISCTAGQILPRFLSPTPRNGEFFNASVNQDLEIRLNATATQSQVNNFIISGPMNITKYNTIRGAVGESVLRWTPTENDLDDHVPICFIAESQSGSRFYHSEMRCIIVIVGNRSINANVVCTENTMTVEVEKASVLGLHEDDLQLADASCTPISNGTHLIATVSLNSCGTKVEENPDYLIFKNEIISLDEIGAVITRKHCVDIDFSCSYPRKGRVALEFKAKKGINVFTEKGFGKFTYQFEFFQSNLFRSILDSESYPVELLLKEMLYIEIKSTSPLPNTVLFVESCKATPVDDPNYHIYYEIITNGCILDETVKTYTSSPQEFRFGIQAFKFIGQHEEVYISCVVILCAAGEPNTRCSQGCLNATPSPTPVHHHHRRAAPTETVRHYISQGPLRLKKTTEVAVSSTGLSMNLVFIAAVLLVAVIILCGAVIYTAKRSKIKYQPLTSSDF